MIELGAVAMTTTQLKEHVKRQVDHWRTQYAKKLHQEGKSEMDQATDLMIELKF